ncbi:MULTISPECIES: hypothetical protein [Vibrio]|nr:MULTISPECIES: hypothetical protein [Vibrio]SQA39069.1 Uncharacterised protein [Vibrio harveyi]
MTKSGAPGAASLIDYLDAFYLRNLEMLGSARMTWFVDATAL